MKEIDVQVQEAQSTPNKINAKGPTPRHIIINMSKVKEKERILKAARKVSYLQGSSLKTVSRFLKRNFTR